MKYRKKMLSISAALKGSLFVAAYSLVLVVVFLTMDVLERSKSNENSVYAMSNHVATGQINSDLLYVEKEGDSKNTLKSSMEAMLRYTLDKVYGKEEEVVSVQGVNEEALNDTVVSEGNQSEQQLKDEKEEPIINKEEKKVDKKIDKKITYTVCKRGDIKISDADRNVLLRIVEAEAGGQGVKGKLLVANVVINRMLSGKYPKSVKAVVHANSNGVYQFSPVRDGRINSVKISSTTVDAVSKALDGEDNSKGAMYFMNREGSSSSNVRWFDDHLTFLFKYGSHEFYK